MVLVALSIVSARTDLDTTRTNLTIWDSTDTITKYNNDSIYFYANFTNSTGVSINGTDINCSIQFNHPNSI